VISRHHEEENANLCNNPQIRKIILMVGFWLHFSPLFIAQTWAIINTRARAKKALNPIIG
jgi:hypothetical protein